MARKPILTLSTLSPERELVEINDTVYEIKSQDDFGLEDSSILERLRRNFAPFVERFLAGEISEDSIEQGALTSEELHDMAVGLHDFCKMILIDCPEEVIGKLHDRQKIQVIEVFMQRVEMPSTTSTPSPEILNRKQRRKTGASSLQPSNGSTGETQTDGSP